LSVAAVQGLSALVFLNANLHDRDHGARRDRLYPVGEMASAVREEWRLATDCPLKFVVGPSFEAGLLLMYDSSHPQVLEDGDPRKSPWIDLGAMQRDGHVTLERVDPSASPARPTIPPRNPKERERMEVVITPPAQQCMKVQREDAPG
jgi:hypothetical protein